MGDACLPDPESLHAIDAIADGWGAEWLASQRERGGALTAKTIQRLRESHGPVAAGWLVEFAAAHAKAREKFGSADWLTTPRAVQQATDRITAAYKAHRFPVDEPIIDICCGIGGDAMALMGRGPTLAIDVDPQIVRMAAANLRTARRAAAANPGQDARSSGGPGSVTPPDFPILVAAVDANRLFPLPPGRLLHIDPDRRPGQRRTTDLNRYQPALPTLEKLMARGEGGAVKLAPATAVPPDWEGRYEREWISLRGSVRQQVVWFGSLCRMRGEDEAVGDSAAGYCRATRLQPDGTVDSFAATAAERSAAWEAVTDFDQQIVDFDAAVRAAGLSAPFANRLGLRPLGGPAGFFTGDRLRNPHPLAERYKILWSGSANLKSMQAAVRELAVQIDVIKVRGASIRPEQIQKKITQASPANAQRHATLLIGNLGKRFYAVIGHRVEADGGRRQAAEKGPFC